MCVRTSTCSKLPVLLAGLLLAVAAPAQAQDEAGAPGEQVERTSQSAEEAEGAEADAEAEPEAAEEARPDAPPAQEDGDTVKAVLVDKGLTISADLRSSYLQGHKLLVRVTVRNLLQKAASFPNLEERPHLVHFELESDSGKTQSRYSTPPQQDSDELWMLPPNAQRHVVLELPSSAALGAGGYRLGLTIQQDDQLIKLGPIDVQLELANPVGADVLQEGGGFQSLGWMTPWVHQGEAGSDLYLYTNTAEVPAVRGLNWHLLHHDAALDPWLSASRPSEGSTRYLYWRDGGKQLGFARLQEQELRRAPRHVGLPYPEWDLLARGGTDTGGGLHIPIWIPAPSGSNGEVRVVSIDPRGKPFLRKVVALPMRPSAASWVDAAGQLRLLLLHEGKLDLYTLGTAAGLTLPAAGERLLPQVITAEGQAALAQDLPPPELEDGAEPAEDTPPVESPEGAGEGIFSGALDRLVEESLAAWQPPELVGATFAPLPDQVEQRGGMAVFAWATDAQGEQARLTGFWLSMDGRVIATVPGVPWPSGHRLAQVLPDGYEPLLLLTLDRKGHGWLHSAAWKEALQLGPVGPEDRLRLDAQGNPHLVQLRHGTGVAPRPLQGQPLEKY